MHDNSKFSSQRQAARIAGLSYLIIIICGISAELIIRSGLIHDGDPSATSRSIAGNEGLFRLSVASDLVMLTFDAIVGVALFVVFRSVAPGIALLATVFRALHTAVYGATLLVLFLALQLSTGTDYLGALGADQSHALATLFIDAHAHGYTLGLIFFAVHLLFLGYLVLKSTYIPRVLGALLLVAAGGYLVDGFANVLLPSYDDYADIFAIVVFAPAFIGELAFGAWLLVKGIRQPAPGQERRAA